MKKIEDILKDVKVKAEQSRDLKEEFVKSNLKPEAIKCKHGVVIEDYEVVYKQSSGCSWSCVNYTCKDCENEAELKRRIEDCSQELLIPARYINAPNKSRFYEKYKKKGGIIMSGSVGTGKTYEAISLMKNIYIKEGLKSSFITGTDLSMELKKAIGDKRFEEAMITFRERELVVIDDLGVENATEFMIESLYSILNYRYNEMLPVILTTNLSSIEFGKIYGQRILSRLNEMTSFERLIGSDKRII
jgi:DNA replication protein DnaC